MHASSGFTYLFSDIVAFSIKWEQFGVKKLFFFLNIFIAVAEQIYHIRIKMKIITVIKCMWRYWCSHKSSQKNSNILANLLLWSFNAFFNKSKFLLVLNLFRMEQLNRLPPLTRFFPCVFKPLWILALTLLPNCWKISRAYLLPVTNYWSWTKTTPQNNMFFWSNSYKAEVMITSFIMVLEYAKDWSHDYIYYII